MKNYQSKRSIIMQPIGIDENRLHHLLGVARACYSYGKEIFDWEEEKSREMFLIGFLHDVGYEFVEDPIEHEEVGGSILKQLGFRYAQEIKSHGDPHSTFTSQELFILNLADLTVSHDGTPCTMQQRLDLVIQRYGENSIQAKRLYEMINLVQNQAKEYGCFVE